MSVDVKSVIERSLEATAGGDPTTPGRMAEQVLKDLAAAGVAVMAPQDLEWGECHGAGVENDGDPHRISLSLCAGCLEYDPE